MTTSVGPQHGLYDERKRKLILRAVERGVPKRQAAQAVGVNAQTLSRWMRDGALSERRREEGLELTEYEERSRAFRALVLRAEGRWMAGAIVAAQELAIVTRRPMAVLEILRRHPVSREEWNVPQRIDVTPIQSDEPPELDDEELAAAIDRLHRIAGERVRDNGPAAANADSGSDTRPRKSVKRKERT